MKRKIITFEIILCLILLLFGVYIHAKTQDRVISVGTFGNGTQYNDTLGDFSINLFGELFYD